MAYPSLEQYNQAFSAHSTLLTDPELRAGTLTKSGLGLPLAISGGFALTYTVNTANGKFAVRCFHRQSKGLERRYGAISKKLLSLRSPYFLDFQFQNPGIRVDGAAYPIVKMAWANGTTLGEFLEDNRKNPAALGRLADALVGLASYLQREGIAHGDLQSGNLMVGRDGSVIQLIDYDGMFVDEIKDLGSAELGHINFQHPQRKSVNPFDSGLDRFSLISLTVSIRALQCDPTIWDGTNSEADAIVFRANDFLDPANSSAFAMLAKSPSLAVYAKNFAAICKSPMVKTPGLADFLAGKNIPAVNINIAPTKGMPGSISINRPGYVGAYPVIAAIDYAACLRAVGDKVEVIGRIVELKEDTTRHGKPYIFINFGPWKSSIFKVSIWSDGFSHLKVRPNASWVGKWVSVVGLMEPPYISKKYNYSHIAITVGAAGQITAITEQEAQWRLAGAGKVAGTFAAANSSNKDTLDHIRTVSGQALPTTPTSRGTVPAPSSNAAIIQKIKSTSSASSSYVFNSSTSSSTSSSRGGSTYRPASQLQHPSQQSQNTQPSLAEKFFKWLFG